MNIVSQYMLISFVLAFEFAIIIWQMIAINRVHKYTLPWALLGSAFVLIGGRQLWAMLKIPIQVQELKERGIDIPPITLEGWLMILSGAIAGILFIAGFAVLKRRYEELGM